MKNSRFDRCTDCRNNNCNQVYYKYKDMFGIGTMGYMYNYYYRNMSSLMDSMNI